MQNPELIDSAARRPRFRCARVLLPLLPLSFAALLAACDDRGTGPDAEVERPLNPQLVAEGREIFRFSTFGDEAFWTDTARMHEVIQSSVSPSLALKVGLKVDADALPQAVKDAIAAGKVDLNDPATTVTLLKLNSVVGLKGKVESVNGRDRLVQVGITCAMCHSSVDNSFAPGIGRRLDGWANRDLNVGAIVALSPAIPLSSKAILQSWGPGKYDPRMNFDGKNTPVMIAPAFGLRGVELATYTGDGPISYWNAYVAVTQMHGQGTFRDPRLGISVMKTADLVTPLLPALREYQLSLMAPAPPAGSFDAAAASRGKQVFNGSAKCSSCHIPEQEFTDVNLGRLHAPSETGMDPAYAERSATKRYRTTPLRGVWQHPPYFHDGSAKTLADVVEHYNRVLKLGLSEAAKRDLVEYLKSL
ncbi:MAG: c-type cytochrome [Gemmatimonadetes bacterium]|nr:c-type cytochrome [Gemmatimonadota bacterium]